MNIKPLELGNKRGAGATGVMITLISLVAVAIIGYIIFSVYQTTQQTALAREKTEAEKSGEQAPPTLTGKPLTLSILAYDRSDKSNVSKVKVPVYVITDPTSSAAEVGGTFAADATSLSATARTDVTSGLTVDGKMNVIATNGTYYGKWKIITPTSQAENVDLDVYKSSGDVNITAEDETGTVIRTSASVSTGTNLTLAASESATLEKFRVKQGAADRSYNLGGFYIDLVLGTNISDVSWDDSSIDGTTATISETNVGFKRTTNDDYIFALSEPVLLLQYDSITSNALTFLADADGCQAGANGPEAITIYAYDSTWFKSTQKDAMLFGGETDATSPTDVGAQDITSIIWCQAS